MKAWRGIIYREQAEGDRSHEFQRGNRSRSHGCEFKSLLALAQVESIRFEEGLIVRSSEDNNGGIRG